MIVWGNLLALCQQSSKTPQSPEGTSHACAPRSFVLSITAGTAGKGFWIPPLENQHQMLMLIFKYLHTIGY